MFSSSGLFRLAVVAGGLVALLSTPFPFYLCILMAIKGKTCTHGPSAQDFVKDPMARIIWALEVGLQLGRPPRLGVSGASA